MPKPRQNSEMDEPLYIRWTPDTCPYALEMRMDLITRLKVELDQADALGIEVGGLFVGVLPTRDAPTLRLEDVVFVPRNVVPGDVRGNTEFLLGPAQLRGLVEMTAVARHSPRPGVGFFRSHLRSTPLAPTVADAAMLAQQFPEGLFAFLMIGASVQLTTPRQAAFYLAMAGHLPETPSSPAFPFDERAFQALSEMPVEEAGQFEEPRRRPIPWPAAISLALLLFLIGTWTIGSRISQLFRPQSNQIDLSVMSSGPNLKITWDHSTPVIAQASGGTLVIIDGPIPRKLKLDTDELRLGQIAYERETSRVHIELRIDAPGNRLPPQTFNWSEY